MKKLLLVLGLVLASIMGFSQTTAPDATKPYLILDQAYELQPVGSGNATDVKIYFDNKGSSATKAVQFKFWYDKNVFARPTVTYVGGETNNYFLTKVDEAEGSAVVTWVYTGANTSYTIGAGALFNVSLPFQSGFKNGTINALSFTGATSFPAYATLADGTDGVLGLQNYGGGFKEPSFQYTATFKNSASNPSTDIPVILQKSSDGTTWTDVKTVKTDTNGEAKFTENLDQSYWKLRVKVSEGLNATSALSTADADMISQIAAGIQKAVGVQFYTANVNKVNDITVSDSYMVFSRLAQNQTSYANRPDVLFFTEAEYNDIVNSTTDKSVTIPGQTTFISTLINNTTGAVYYLLVIGDANGTGLN